MRCRGKIYRLVIIILVLSVFTIRPGCEDGGDSSIEVPADPYAPIQDDITDRIKEKSSPLPSLHQKASRQRLPLEDFYYAFTDIDYRLP